MTRFELDHRGWLWDSLSDSEPVMTNTWYEYRANYPFLSHAHGDVLIFGWGIRFITKFLQIMPQADSITVVELFPEVVELSPTPNDVRIPERFVQGNFWTCRPCQTYDTIYADLFGGPGMQPENPDTYPRLKGLRKYLRPGGWIGKWNALTAETMPGWGERRRLACA